jgi:predicted amidohydrolase YtcJ
VAASSDSPYGPLNPWRVMASAVNRCTEQGFVFAETEKVEPVEAMRGYLSQPDRPGGPARVVRVGAQSDLCILDRTFAAACLDLSAVNVDYTVISGCLVYRKDDSTSSLCSPR